MPSLSPESPLSRAARWALVTAVLANMAIQMVMASSGDTATFDEPFHIGAAMEKYNGDLQWGADHPPFAHLILGLPLQLLEFETPEHAAEQIDFDGYVRGRDYMFQGGEDHAARVLQRARLAIVLVTLATMLILFLFAQDLFGFWGGVLALIFASANPSVLAHGRLATTDMAVTGLVLASVWLIWRSRRSSRRTLVLSISALMFGLALATKFTALVMLPLALLLVLWSALRGEPEIQSGVPRVAVPGAMARGFVSVILFGCVSLATVWAVYLAIDPQLEYRSRVTEEPVELTDKIAALLPLPEPYRDGLRLQVMWDSVGRAGFLFGEKYLGGKASFYPASLAMKSPLALIAAFILGSIAWVTIRRRPLDLLMLLLLPVSFLLFAMTTGTNLGVRHVLIVPLFMALVGGAMALKRSRAWLAASIGLSVWALVATWSSYPAHIAYINEAFGGSDNAYKLVGDSNVDWGQDLVRLRDYLESHEVPQPVWLAYFGQVPVEEYHLPVTIADPDTVGEIQGTLAISVSKINNSIPGSYDRLVENRRPFAQIGHSILLYHIGPSAAGASNG
ncbi:MAG: glycosyltransferase family 39 protein [Actinomycetota bacterium]